MSDSELIQKIHNNSDLYKLWRKLTRKEKELLLKLKGDLPARFEEVKTGQRNLFRSR